MPTVSSARIPPSSEKNSSESSYHHPAPKILLYLVILKLARKQTPQVQRGEGTTTGRNLIKFLTHATANSSQSTWPNSNTALHSLSLSSLCALTLSPVFFSLTKFLSLPFSPVHTPIYTHTERETLAHSSAPGNKSLGGTLCARLSLSFALAAAYSGLFASLSFLLLRCCFLRYYTVRSGSKMLLPEFCERRWRVGER